MTRIIGVRFKPVGKIYYFDPAGIEIKEGDNVIVETSRSVELGKVVIGPKDIDDAEITKPLKSVLRIATEEDLALEQQNHKDEKEAIKICSEKIKEHKLNMNLVDVEYTFDRTKLLFYFTSESRVDFRELVKDLATIFRTRIELRQIGVRDESKIMSSVGVCGRDICCSRFLGDFAPVSIKMAKEQGISLSPSKISGICGRLMCCLKFEQDTYEELWKTTPHEGAIVETPKGKGTVEYTSVLKGQVKVKLDSAGEHVLEDFNVNDIKIIKNGRNKNNNDKIDEELLKKLED